MGNLNSVQIPDFMVPCAYGTLYASVRNKFNEFRPVFESLPLNERFSFLYNFALSEDLFCELQFEPAKSKLKALEFKKRGNEVFHQGKFLSALKLYTKSVAFAPPNSKELAVAFANRSAALLRLKRYEACLVDINRALKENHSEVTEAWKQKLLDRKKECVVNLKKFCATEMNRLVRYEHIISNYNVLFYIQNSCSRKKLQVLENLLMRRKTTECPICSEGVIY